MHKLLANFPLLASWGMKIIMVVIFGLEIFAANYLTAIAAFLAFLISLMPMFWDRNFKFHAPWQIDFSITLALFLHIFGVFYDLYHSNQWWWWDNMTHFLGTAVIAILAFYLIFILDYTEKINLTATMMAMATWLAALAIGALWEIAEYYIDQWLGTNLVQGITDTIHDLLFDILGAVVVATIGASYVRHWRIKKNLT